MRSSISKWILILICSASTMQAMRRLAGLWCCKPPLLQKSQLAIQHENQKKQNAKLWFELSAQTMCNKAEIEKRLKKGADANSVDVRKPVAQQKKPLEFLILHNPDTAITQLLIAHKANLNQNALVCEVPRHIVDALAARVNQHVRLVHFAMLQERLELMNALFASNEILLSPEELEQMQQDIHQALRIPHKTNIWRSIQFAIHHNGPRAVQKYYTMLKPQITASGYGQYINDNRQPITEDLINIVMSFI